MARTIALLIFPGFQLQDVAGPLAAFEAANGAVASTYRLRVVAEEAGAVASSCGIAILAERATGSAVDTLIVSGGCGKAEAAVSEKTLSYIGDSARRARRTASVCTGAFLLAAAGLLAGKHATTHWAHVDEFRRAYPKVKVEPDQIFIRDGDIWTSAGITAGIDLALALIADDLGEAVAKRVAQELVVYWRRPAGQSQFSALLDIDRPSRFSAVLSWARERLSEPLSVEQLAERAAMSPRHFARAFTAETGVTPAKAVERLRLEVARERVESRDDPLDVVARKTGFNDADRMRKAFLRAFDQSPQVMRRMARKAMLASEHSA